ncbi:MAG: hypothetical protein MK101_06205 [Phycisphaerales bacterium]|nr:hypothetical protein [Phycisphaerales bacterium]
MWATYRSSTRHSGVVDAKWRGVHDMLAVLAGLGPSGQTDSDAPRAGPGPLWARGRIFQADAIDTSMT